MSHQFQWREWNPHWWRRFCRRRKVCRRDKCHVGGFVETWTLPRTAALWSFFSSGCVGARKSRVFRRRPRVDTVSPPWTDRPAPFGAPRISALACRCRASSRGWYSSDLNYGSHQSLSRFHYTHEKNTAGLVSAHWCENATPCCLETSSTRWWHARR